MRRIPCRLSLALMRSRGITRNMFHCSLKQMRRQRVSLIGASKSGIYMYTPTFVYPLPSEFPFPPLRKEEPLLELSPQTPVYSWPRRTHVADEVMSSSCVRSSLSSCPFSWCPLRLYHSYSPSVVCESCNVPQCVCIIHKSYGISALPQF